MSNESRIPTERSEGACGAAAVAEQGPNPESRRASESRLSNPESRLLNESRLPVAAALLRDAQGRVLMAQRPAGRAHAGLWEFPGGKIESGESGPQALARELVEELGIRVEPAHCRPLIALPFAYPGLRIRLEVFEVEGFAGEPQGREGQALRWCAPHDAMALPMPDADRPVLPALLDAPTYAITPAPGGDRAAFLAGFERLLAAGHRRVQLRAPGLEAETVRELAIACAARARAAGATLLLNGESALARELGLGLHLRAAQLMALDRRPLPAGQTVAASCHDAAELARAEALGLDFAVLGPVKVTASHPGAAVLGWDGFVAARERCSLPVYALGGLDPGDLDAARAHGAQGIAAIRAFWPG